MNLAFYFLVFYTAMLFAGAYFGGKAGSRVSVIMGLISGFLMSFAVSLISHGNDSGRLLTVAVAVLLAIVFLIRWVKTKKFMPSGLLLIFSGVALLATFYL